MRFRPSVAARSRSPNTIDRLDSDLDEILAWAREDIGAFAGQRLFITGGTGFVGSWFLRSIVHANARTNARISADVLTRDPAVFLRAVPACASDDRLHFITGDVTTYRGNGERYDAVFHAATPASAQLNIQDPARMLEITIEGTRRALEVARPSGAIPFLLTSSGAVYGVQPPDMANVDESYAGAPSMSDAGAAYHEGKRVSELLLTLAARDGLAAKVARLFAFVGPYLPLDKHFAIGNFIRDGLSGGPIKIGGDGTPFRSYLYATDMTAWLWAIFARGATARPYNVGSARAIDIASLARKVASFFSPESEVRIAREPLAGALASRYVPEVTRIEGELNVAQRVSLDESLRRTIDWHRR